MRPLLILIWFGAAVLQFALYSAIIYVVWHFISKYW